jgi:hypothetical protein
MFRMPILLLNPHRVTQRKHNRINANGCKEVTVSLVSMKATVLIVSLALTFRVANSQELREVVLTRQEQVVPEGMKWLIEANGETVVEVNKTTLESGNLCNARLLSNPGILTVIIDGDLGDPNEAYGLLFESLEKVSFTNESTFRIKIASIVDSRFNLSELSSKPLEKIGMNNVTFLPGTKLYVTECLTAIKIREYRLNKSDHDFLKANPGYGVIKNDKVKSIMLPKEDITYKCKPTLDTLSQRMVYSVVDERPAYPGGDIEFVNTVTNNINSIDGCYGKAKIVLSFIVEENGEVTNKTVLQGWHCLRDEEIVKGMEIAKTWTAGRCNNKNVAVRMIVPVNFNIN